LRDTPAGYGFWRAGKSLFTAPRRLGVNDPVWIQVEKVK